MIKILIWLAIFYLGFRLLKAWVLSHLFLPRDRNGPSGEIEDVMVQDPVCGVYIPRREALPARHQGQDVFFCSEKCKNEFLK